MEEADTEEVVVEEDTEGVAEEVRKITLPEFLSRLIKNFFHRPTHNQDN